MTRRRARVGMGLACAGPAAAMLLLAGCGRAATAAPDLPEALRLPTNAATVGLQRAAGLAPCPASSGQRVSRLPDVTLPCLGGGGTVRLAHLAGVPAVINIWASWCAPCYREMPAFQQLHAVAGDRLLVLGVDTADDPNKALHATIDIKVHYASVYDIRRQFAAGLVANVQPTTVFVRADGGIAHVKVGPVAGLTELTALVRQYLGVAL